MKNYKKILIINNDKIKNLKLDNRIIINENHFVIYKYVLYLKYVAALLFIIIKYKIS